MDRSKAVDLAITQIERQFGKGSIMKLGSSERVADVPAISTGSLSLDIALGTFGVPRGRVIEIYGPESGGKTTLALHVVAEAQKKGGIAAYIDAEHALDVTYAKNIGVNTDDLLISQPDTGESRPWRSPRRWCAAAPWTSWSSTPSLPWCLELSLRVRWAIPQSACRRGS
jgi:recombination protein RecA